MMHEWLNVGYQKERISGSATDALCPCCGLQHVDQSHMFRCPSASVRNTINQGLKTMAKVFRRDNIPSGIARTFLNKVSKATADPSPRVPVQCPEAGIACKAQDRLEAIAIIRGHHHKQWYFIISKTCKKRTHPSDEDEKKTKKNKSPLELCATLVSEVWCLFKKIWENRNDCLHHPTDMPLAHINDRLNEHLTHYKRNKNALLAYTNRRWIKHPEHVMQSWSLKKKCHLLRVLDGWHSNTKPR